MIAVRTTFAAIAAIPATETFTVEERPLAWEELGPQTFDPRWLLPERPPESEPDLQARMEALATLEFDAEAADGSSIRTLGDFLRSAQGSTFEERRSWWRRTKRQDPRLFEEHGETLFRIVFDDALRAADWSPRDEHPRDGILEGEEWTLGPEAGAPWTGIDVDPKLHQVALWIDADLRAIKQVETDFARYPEHRGANYEAIHPLADGAWRGLREDGDEFSVVRLYFRSDLPFPFGDYDCDLRMLNRRDAQGRLVTDIYSVSPDFHWLAGRDVYLPLSTGDGDPAGFLLVRVYGFDLDGVPDEPKHRLRSLRGSVGNLKRGAEAAQEDGAHERPGKGIPAYTITGRRL